jgi:hypothetical protein
MPRVIRAMTRLPWPAHRAAVSETSLSMTHAPGILLAAHAFLGGQPLPLHRYHFIVEAIKAGAQGAGAGRLALNPREET